jgi:hypothetical protein
LSYRHTTTLYTLFTDVSYNYFKMRSELWFLAAVGFANATELVNREPQATGAAASYSNWHPKTNHAEFFSLRVDIPAACNSDPDDGDYEGAAAPDCTMRDMAIRLSDGYVIASNYTKWWDPKLPIFFTDDHTKLYTVSFTNNFILPAKTYLTSSHRSARPLCSYTSTSCPVRYDTASLEHS